MEKAPLVSICMPAYNVDSFIEETIRSVISQTFKNWELIIVDDGSTDSTPAILSKTIDHRITVLSPANQGAAAARNLAYQKSAGKYIVFFDADDYMAPHFLETQLAKSVETPNALIMSDWKRFNGEVPDKILAEPVPFSEMYFDDWIAEYWYHCNPMTNPGRALIPRSVIEKAGNWNETLSLNDDLEFFTRIMLSADKIIFNHDAVLGYRSNGTGLSSSKKEESVNSLFKSIDLSVKMVLQRYGEHELVRKSCANMWQSFIYITFPGYPDLVLEAQEKIHPIAKPDFKYPAGGVTRFLIYFLGWKLTRRLKTVFA
ncbi:glycosyltransferase family 2 protein [Mucilaginibacter sp. dw_454]|uniref:glycosyltransferase family 2 protein n=1 Tax=Mucilaginibacter sp. dw_454 TaxID=2720079 RepID=UPI001BD6D183|nr:glycosyltransferase family 2 protein [Mucilaginibacter sp. dw_454]